MIVHHPCLGFTEQDDDNDPNIIIGRPPSIPRETQFVVGYRHHPQVLGIPGFRVHVVYFSYHLFDHPRRFRSYFTVWYKGICNFTRPVGNPNLKEWIYDHLVHNWEQDFSIVGETVKNTQGLLVKKTGFLK